MRMVAAEFRIDRFSSGYKDQYPRRATYHTTEQGGELHTRNSKGFRNGRRSLMEGMLKGEANQIEMAEALAMEHLVQLTLQQDLEAAGFWIDMAPQTLDHKDDGQKSVDLLVGGPGDLVYMGIDVKMRRGKSKRDRDGYGWSSRLCSPYFYLSLGNCRLETWEREDVAVREWLRTYVIPKIMTTGKIPRIEAFRQYLVGRMERSLYAYVERLAEGDNYHNDFGIPQTVEERDILIEKLMVMHYLFANISARI